MAKKMLCALLLVAALAVLAACTGGGDATPAVEEAPENVAESVVEPEPEPVAEPEPVTEPEPVDEPEENAVSDGITIGMLQIIDHPALDAARNGFINGLAEEGWVEGVNVTYMHFNAQGDQSNAHAMAQQIVDTPADLILGIATPTSQALANATDTIPIVITAVTDPLRAGLVESFERPNTNVTGTSDLTPVTQQFTLLTNLLPEAQVVGIMFNAGEVNSQIQADMAMDAARALGLDYIQGVVTSTADVAQVAESIIEQVDVIYIPTCNTIAAAYTTVIRIAEDMGIPVIVGEEAGLPQGALATEGINYYNLGRQTAVMAGQILRGEAVPQEMPIQWQAYTTLTINTAAAERLGITIPDDLLATANIVEY